MSIVHRMSMNLESEFLDSLQIKAETLQRNQSVQEHILILSKRYT